MGRGERWYLYELSEVSCSRYGYDLVCLRCRKVCHEEVRTSPGALTREAWLGPTRFGM